MGAGYQTSTLCNMLTYSLHNGAVGPWTEIGSMDNYSIAIAQLIEGCEQTKVLMVACNNLIAWLPVQTEENNIEAFAGIIGQRNLIFLGMQETCNSLACGLIRVGNSFKCL